jgi:hypothetical protein
MFLSILSLFFVVLGVVADQLRGVSIKELFIQDVVLSIVGTIYDGVEEARKFGNDHYRLFVIWQDYTSKQNDCNRCHFETIPETIRTKDGRYKDYTREGFIFPQPSNANIPTFQLNKDEILAFAMKQIVDLFSGVDVFLENDTCCHVFQVYWQ